MDLIGAAIICAIVAAGALIGIAVVRLIRYSRRTGGLPRHFSFGSILRALGHGLIIVLLLVILVAVFGPVGLVGCSIVLFLLIEGYRKRRVSQQNALLWMLVVSAERSMPLGPAIEAFAAEQNDLFGMRAKRLAELLAAGAPLPDALELCPKLLPSYAMPMLRIGCESGALAPALRQAATAYNQHGLIWASLSDKIGYVVVMPILGLAVITFVMVWIVPRLTAIFREFHAELPPMTQWLIYAAYFFVNYWYLFFPVYLPFAWLIVYAVMRYFGWTEWDAPFVGRLVRRLDSARILDGLALIARQQRPLAEGIATLADAYPKSDVRRRLTLAAFDVEAGADWAESLSRQSLIRRADLAVLQAAQRVGNLPWAMQEMADSARRRFIYKVQAIVQAAFPAVVICFGAMVMFIVVALFLPLVALIQRMA